MKKNKGNTRATPPKREPVDWESCNFKLPPEMKRKVEADMVIEDCPTEAEYFRMLLRLKFKRVL